MEACSSSVSVGGAASETPQRAFCKKRKSRRQDSIESEGQDNSQMRSVGKKTDMEDDASSSSSSLPSKEESIKQILTQTRAARESLFVAPPLQYENRGKGSQSKPFVFDSSSDEDDEVVESSPPQGYIKKPPFVHNARVDFDGDDHVVLAYRRAIPLPMPMHSPDDLLQDEMVKDMTDTTMKTVQNVEVTPRPARPKARPVKKTQPVHSLKLIKGMHKITKSGDGCSANDDANDAIAFPDSDDDAFFKRPRFTASNTSAVDEPLDTFQIASSTSSPSIGARMAQAQGQAQASFHNRNDIADETVVHVATVFDMPSQHDSNGGQSDALAQQSISPSNVSQNIVALDAAISSEEEVDELNSDMDASESEKDELMSTSEREDTAMTEVDEGANFCGSNSDEGSKEDIPTTCQKPLAIETGVFLLSGEEEVTEVPKSCKETFEESVAQEPEARPSILVRSDSMTCSFDAEKATDCYGYECRDRHHSHSSPGDESCKYNCMVREDSDGMWRYYGDGAVPSQARLITKRQRRDDQSSTDSQDPYVRRCLTEPIVEEQVVLPSLIKFSAPYDRDPAPFSDDEISLTDDEGEIDCSIATHQAALANLGRKVAEGHPSETDAQDVEYLSVPAVQIFDRGGEQSHPPSTSTTPLPTRPLQKSTLTVQSSLLNPLPPRPITISTPVSPASSTFDILSGPLSKSPMTALNQSILPVRQNPPASDPRQVGDQGRSLGQDAAQERPEQAQGLFSNPKFFGFLRW